MCGLLHAQRRQGLSVPIRIGSLAFVKFGKCASENKIFAEIVVFFLTTVAPIHVVGLQDLGPLGNPFLEGNVV